MAIINGTAGADSLLGTEGADLMQGFDGDDYLTGRAGDDLLIGGSGNDGIFGGVGADNLIGGDGFDQFIIDSFDEGEIVDGGEGRDTIQLGYSGVFPSSDLSAIDFDLTNLFLDLALYGTGILNGVEFRSIEQVFVNFTHQADKLTLGSSYLSDGAFWLDDGDDAFVGGSGQDVVFGGQGDDVILGQDGDDRLIGHDGDDILTGGTGADRLDGGNGFDIALYSDSAAPVVADLHFTFNNLGEAAGDTYAGIEGLVGTCFADDLSGDTSDNLIKGGDGSDTIDGREGRDQLYGEAGTDNFTGRADGDTIDGGVGYDIVRYEGLAHAYSVATGGMGASIASGQGADQITSTEDIRFRDATLTFDTDSNAAFVMRLYDSAFNRPPETLGLDYWVDQLDANVSRSTIANIFLQSPEFAAASGTLSTSDFVDFLYAEVLGRAPEDGATAYWASQIDGGMSRGDALFAFSESAEHRASTAGTLANGLWVTDNDYQKVAALYDAFADRLPDLAGLNYWVGQVKGGMSIKQVADSFVGSQEFADNTNGFSSSQLVDYIYESALNRPAEAGGRAYWAQQVDAGLSKGDLLLNIGLSAEHFQILEQHLFAGVDYLI